MTEEACLAQILSVEEAACGFARLMAHICELYTCGESSSVSEFEGNELAASALYVLGFPNNDRAALQALCSDDVIAAWTHKRLELEHRIPCVMELWQSAVALMPPIRNIALRDTLCSIGRLPSSYDTFFAAHVVPCSIDYPLSQPVSEDLQGLDYIEAWLAQLHAEADFLAQFDLEDMVGYLDAWCPDYQGLLINVHDPIREAWEAGLLQKSVIQ